MICRYIIYIHLYVVISYKDQISSTQNVPEGGIAFLFRPACASWDQNMLLPLK